MHAVAVQVNASEGETSFATAENNVPDIRIPARE
jgi:hypothetical protein